MREQQNKRSQKSRESSNENKLNSKESYISASKLRGIRVLVGLLLLYQTSLFVYNKWFNEPLAEEIQLSNLFSFNPNTITLDSLVLLGLSPKQAQTIINYRAKGGKFRKREDFAKMYVVTPELYSRVKGRIVIEQGQKKQSATAQGYMQKERQVVAEDTIGTSLYTTTDASKSASTTSSTSSTASSKSLSAASKSGLFGKQAPRKQPYICNLNSADSTALVKLYGIGPYYAKKILEYRDRLGGSFVAIEQLMEVYGVDSAKFNSIKKNITIESNSIKKFKLEGVTTEFLEKHPYIGAYAARGVKLLIKINREKDSTHHITAQELIDNNIIDEVNGKKLEYYLQ